MVVFIGFVEWRLFGFFFGFLLLFVWLVFGVVFWIVVVCVKSWFMFYWIFKSWVKYFLVMIFLLLCIIMRSWNVVCIVFELFVFGEEIVDMISISVEVNKWWVLK